ncbi:cytosine permease [Streptomyces sp. NPDC055815]
MPETATDGAAADSVLYTYDMAPTKREGRRWGAYNVFTLWANDVHSLGNYAFAIGLFALGLSVWGILAAFALASVLLFLLLTLSGLMGHKTGAPFPVMSRIAFGIKGAKIPAAVCGIVAIAVSIDAPLIGGEMWLQIVQAAALWVVVYGTFVLNFCDSTRSAKSRASIVRGNVIGIPLNMLFFAGIVVVLSGAQFKLDGRVITSPTDIVRTIPNMALLAAASLALIALTVAVNLLANFVAPIYALIDLFPRKLDFRRAGVVSAVIGLVILPWNLYNSPIAVNYFLGGLGALLGPLFGVITADYWLLRRARVNVPDLYTEHPQGEYHYRRGFNPRAVAAFVPSAAVAVVVALVPFFHAVAGFSWFVGAILGADEYAIVADRTTPIRDVDGEAIAVDAE